MGIQWESNEHPMESNGNPWNPMEIQWKSNGNPMESNGNPMEIQWNQRWLLRRGEEEKKTIKMKIENELVSDVIYFRKTSQN